MEAPPRPLATPDQVSAYLQVKIPTLHMWHHRKSGPKAIKVGRELRYRWSDVEKWLDERTNQRESGADDAAA